MMVPTPVEGGQHTPMSGGMQQVVAVSQMGGGAPGGATIPLGRLIDFILQRTYHELSVLAELLPRKMDMERKIEIVQFASRTRQLFVRLLALVKWAASASKVERCSLIMSFLDKQSSLFVDTADILALTARETLVHARLPSFHLPCAVEVMTLGTYSRLPTCIRERIVPPDPITTIEKRSTLLRLNQTIQYRLVSSELPPQMRNLRIENGRVIFHVEHEFEVSLTLMGDSLSIPWRLLDIDILVEDKETGDGKSLVHSLQVAYIYQLAQSRLIDNAKPLYDLYNVLHAFCLSLQLEVLHSQVLRLCSERLGDFIRVDEYCPGSRLVLLYWREQLTKDEQGFKIIVQIAAGDPRPLQVSHSPHLDQKDAALADQAIKSDHLSVEKLLIHCIHIRTKHKLSELLDQLQPKVGGVECCIVGSPAVLYIPLLQPCMQSEQLLVSVDTHTGFLLPFIPQFSENTSTPPPYMDQVQEMLNKDPAKVDGLLMELRYWLTLRRCEKTIQHLPALTSENLPLTLTPDHPLAKLGKHKLFIKLCKHQHYYIAVDLSISPLNICQVDLTFYLVTLEPSPLDDFPSVKQEQEMDNMMMMEPLGEPTKAYLKVINCLKLDTFAITHGPCTKVDSMNTTIGNKRKLKSDPSPSLLSKKPKHTGNFISSLAHVVAMCDERIPFSTLTVQLNMHGICHQGVQVEAEGANYVVKVVQLPPCEGCHVDTVSALTSALLSCTIRLQGKGTRFWLIEFVYCNCPLVSLLVKEQGPRRPVYFMYDFASGTNAHVGQMVDEALQDWSTMGHLYSVAMEFADALKHDQHNALSPILDIKSFTYKKLVLGYGPNKANTVTIYWRPSEKRFHLAFGIVGVTSSASNPHSLVSAQLQHEFNQHCSVVSLLQVLHYTYKPLLSLSKLPSAPQLGMISSRPQVALQPFVILPQSSTHIRVVYRIMYCIDMYCRPDGLVTVRDGAYSVFDKGKAVEELVPIQGLKAFLSKFVDETASQFRRRSQSEDDNPPSPVTSLEGLEHPFCSQNVKPASPAQQRGATNEATSGGPGSVGSSAGGLRFGLHPMTPPSVSNPHTPASPHTSMLSQQPNYGASPNPSFSLASPPSLGSQSHVSPSPSMMHMQAASPGNLFSASSPVNPLHVPSPSFLPTPSPSSSTASSQVASMQSPAAPFMSGQGHAEAGSPFATPQGGGQASGQSTGNLSMSSPAPMNWPGSPSMPRPSPRPLTTVQSPGSSVMHSPQAAILAPPSRILPQRSWAASTPTVLSDKAFDVLCSPGPAMGAMPPGTQLPLHYSPFERFLGCVFIRRSLHRTIQSDETLTLLPATEPGVIQFKVEMLQFKINLNTNTMQSLHLKLSPTLEFKDQWSADELAILERFFDTKVVSAPYKPNAFLAFGRLLNAPIRILKDCIHIMRLELIPDRSLKWAVQWCLTIPPAAPPIAPAGMSAVVMVNNKMLFFLQLTRLGLTLPAGAEPQTVAVSIVYDMNTNVTQLAERRDHVSMAPTAPIAIIGSMLRRFSEYNPQPGECSIFPAIRDLLTNLVIPI